jgi:exonuclease SbcD
MTIESSTVQGAPSKPPGAYRVLHTADWHLGKMLGEHSRHEEHRRFLEFLLQCIREQHVDALLVAGDIFDSANPPQTAESQYYDFLSELYQQGGCSIVIVAGNHDSPARLEAPRQVLKALRAHVVGAWPASCADALIPLPNATSPRIVVAAVPFLRDRDLRTGQTGQGAAEIQRALVDGIKRCYEEIAVAAKPWLEKGIPLVATGHLTTVGSRSSDSEREIHVGGLGAIGVECFSPAFKYVALGHLHRPQTAKANAVVRYAGSPIPLSFSEAGDKKTVQLLDFIKGDLAQITELEIPLARPLTQLSVTRESFERELANLPVFDSELQAWVEVIVENPVPGENLYDRAQEISRARGFEVVQVVSKRDAAVPGVSGNGLLEADVADLLAEPEKVFAHRLETETGLTDPERASLKSVFHELLDLQAQRERDGIAK